MTPSEYIQQLEDYIYMLGNKGKIVTNPKLDDDKAELEIDGHYHFMGVWAFKKILENKPKEHIDFGGLISWLGLVSCVVKTTSYDVRSISINQPNLQFKLGSVLDTKLKSNSVKSLSCLHVAEHIGLGRYGDPLDKDGTYKACRELARILAPGGRLYFAVPTGIEVTIFNAHRILSPYTVLDYFKDLRLVSISGSHVYEKAAEEGQTNYIENVEIGKLANSRYACGMYELVKD